MNGRLVTFVVVSTDSQAQGALDTEHGKDALVAHPELCVIVVDILSQLIEKYVFCSIYYHFLAS